MAEGLGPVRASPGRFAGSRRACALNFSVTGDSGAGWASRFVRVCWEPPIGAVSPVTGAAPRAPASPVDSGKGPGRSRGERHRGAPGVESALAHDGQSDGRHWSLRLPGAPGLKRTSALAEADAGCGTRVAGAAGSFPTDSRMRPLRHKASRKPPRHPAFLRAPGPEAVFGHRRAEHGAIQGPRFPDHRLTCSRDGMNRQSLSGGPRRRTQASDVISDPQWQQLSPSRGCDPVEPSGFPFWRRDFRWRQVRGRHPGTGGC